MMFIDSSLYMAAQMPILNFLGWCSPRTSKCPISHGRDSCCYKLFIT